MRTLFRSSTKPATASTRTNALPHTSSTAITHPSSQHELDGIHTREPSGTHIADAGLIAPAKHA